MALSGSNTWDVPYTSGYLKIKIDWSATQNVVANTSDVTVKVYVVRGAYGYNTNSTSDASTLWIDGTPYYSSSSVGGANNTTSLIAQHTKTVAHTADGSKSFSIKFSHYFGLSWGGTWIGTQTFGDVWHTLNTIPRASGIDVRRLSDLAVISTAEYGQTVRVHISRASSGFTHTVRANWNGIEETLWDKVDYVDMDWLIPLTYMNRIPNTASTWGTLFVDTYSGSTKLGTSSVTLTTNVPASIVPTLTSLTVAELTAGVSTVVGAGNYIQGMSKPQVTVNGASGTYSSTISSYKVTFEGATISATNNVIALANVKGSGSQTISVTVTDSRGRTSAVKSLNINVLPYSMPILEAFSVKRKAGAGSTLQATFAGTISALAVASVQKNVMQVKVEVSPKGADTWTSAYTAQWTTVASVNTTVSLTGTFSEASSFDVRITFYDKFNNSLQTVSISTSAVPLSYSKTGVGIGKVWERGALDVMGDAYFSDNVQITKNLTVTGTGGNVYHTGRKPTLAELGAESTVDYGTNANGSYIKFDNGVVIAWKTLHFYDGNGFGTGYTFDWNIGTLPIALSDFKVHAEAHFYDWNGWYGNFRVIVGNATGRAGNAYVYSGGTGAKDMYLDCFIIGKV